MELYRYNHTCRSATSILSAGVKKLATLEEDDAVADGDAELRQGLLGRNKSCFPNLKLIYRK